MKNEVIVSEALDKVSRADFNTFFNLYSRSFEPEDRISKKELIKLLKTKTNGTRNYLVLAKEGSVVVGGGIFTYSNASKMIYCPWVATDPDLRSKGWGKIIVSSAESHIKKSNARAKYFVIETHLAKDKLSREAEARGNAWRMVKFWESQGFRKVIVPGIFVGTQGIPWDLRVKTLNEKEQRKIPKSHVARILIDLYKNPSMYNLNIKSESGRVWLNNKGKRFVSVAMKGTSVRRGKLRATYDTRGPESAIARAVAPIVNMVRAPQDKYKLAKRIVHRIKWH